MPRRAKIVAALAAIIAAASSDAAADAPSDLEKAYSAYVAHKYDEAEARLRSLLDPGTGALKDADVVADARMYLGAVLVAEKRKEEAGGVFEQLLVDKPDYVPDPLRVSTEGIDAFYDAQSRLHGRLAALKAERVRKEQEARARIEAERLKAAARLAMLEKLAAEEVVTRRSSRWVALVPFGAGQFQNGQDALGFTLLGSEVALALGSGAGAALMLYNGNQARDALARQDATASVYQQHAIQAAWVGDIFAAAFAAVALAGIVQAEVSFVPERTEVRMRPLPSLSLRGFVISF